METRSALITPTQKSQVVVDRLRPGETDAAADVLARSFVHERFWSYVFEGASEQAMVRAMKPWFRVWLRRFAPFGEIHTARRADQLVGVAIRTAPGVYPLTGFAKVGFTLQLMGSVLRMGFTRRRALRMPGAASVIERHEPHEPFWHLAWLGVLPEAHGSGVGGALADMAISCIDAQPAKAWLLTFGPQTRALYERRGFEVTHDIRPLPDGPAGWTMERTR